MAGGAELMLGAEALGATGALAADTAMLAPELLGGLGELGIAGLGAADMGIAGLDAAQAAGAAAEGIAPLSQGAQDIIAQSQALPGQAAGTQVAGPPGAGLEFNDATKLWNPADTRAAEVNKLADQLGIDYAKTDWKSLLDKLHSEPSIAQELSSGARNRLADMGIWGTPDRATALSDLVPKMSSSPTSLETTVAEPSASTEASNSRSLNFADAAASPTAPPAAPPKDFSVFHREIYNPIEPSAATSAAKKGILSQMLDKWSGLPFEEKMLYSGLGSLGLKFLKDDAKRYGVPPQEPYTGPLSQFKFNPASYNPSSSYLPMYRAQGGIMGLNTPAIGVGYSDGGVSMGSGGVSDLGSYSDGGRLLKDAEGDGMNDGIPATIAGKRPAQLSDGEFVIPADVVSDLGNGSTDAGAKALYAMMDRVRMARHGTEDQGEQITPNELMPA